MDQTQTLEEELAELTEDAKSYHRKSAQIKKAEAKVSEHKGARKEIENRMLARLARVKALGVAPKLVVKGHSFSETILQKREGTSPKDHTEVNKHLVAEGLPEVCGKPKYSAALKHWEDLGEKPPRWFMKYTAITEVVKLSVRKVK